MRSLKYFALLALFASSVVHLQAQVQDGPSYYNNPQNGSPVQDGPSYYNNPQNGSPIQDGPSSYDQRSGYPVQDGPAYNLSPAGYPNLNGPSYYYDSQTGYYFPDVTNGYTLCDFYPNYPPACRDQPTSSNRRQRPRSGAVTIVNGPNGYRRNFPRAAKLYGGNSAGSSNSGNSSYRGFRSSSYDGNAAVRGGGGFTGGSLPASTGNSGAAKGAGLGRKPGT